MGFNRAVLLLLVAAMLSLAAGLAYFLLCKIPGGCWN